MKIFLMTDMEGVCGVVKREEWVEPQGRYYEKGKELLALETNAAVEGFFEAGATEILVVDGHGYGGVDHLLLDERVNYLRGPTPGPYPFMLDDTFDATAWVGQHAKSGTEYAHMPHTGSYNIIDYQINNISIGEFGQIAYCGAHFGAKPIFGSGDKAFTLEAATLVEGIETVSVKEGIMPGSGNELTEENYRNRNNGAIHLHPNKARKRIKEGAKRSLHRFIENRNQFKLLNLKAPLIKKVKYRCKNSCFGYVEESTHNDIVSLFNSTFQP